VQLTQTLGLDSHDGGGDGGCNREVARVNDLDRSTAARGWGCWVLRGVVNVGAVAGEGSIWAAGGNGADVALQDVRVGGWDGAEDRGVDTEVLGEDVFGSVGDPVVNHESCSTDWSQHVIDRA